MESTDNPIPTETFLLPGQQFCIGLPWERADLPKHGVAPLPPPPPRGNTLDHADSSTDPFTGYEIGPYRVLRRLSPGTAKTLLAVREDPKRGTGLYVLRRIDLPEVLAGEVKTYADWASQYRHPHIARVHDTVASEEGLFWVTDFAPGPTLAEITAAARKQGRGIPVGFALATAHEAALGLAELHTPGNFTHGLVSDQTVSVSFDGTTTLLDVGLFRCIARKTSWAEVLEPMGPYFAPEQVQQGRLPDPKCDVYSLAVVLYECLAAEKVGRHGRFDDKNRMSPQRTTFAPPSSLNVTLGRQVDEVMARALAEDRSKRYPNAREFAKALKDACSPFMWRSEQRARFVAELFPTRHRHEQQLISEYERRKQTALSLPEVRIVEPPPAPRHAQLQVPVLAMPLHFEKPGQPVRASRGKGLKKQQPPVSTAQLATFAAAAIIAVTAGIGLAVRARTPAPVLDAQATAQKVEVAAPAAPVKVDCALASGPGCPAPVVAEAVPGTDDTAVAAADEKPAPKKAVRKKSGRRTASAGKSRKKGDDAVPDLPWLK